MEKIDGKQFLNQIGTEIHPFNVYGLDVQYDQYYSVEHYIEHKNDTIDVKQTLGVVFLDIEVFTNNANTFPEVTKAAYPINCITIYFNLKREYHSYYTLLDNHKDKFNDLTAIQEKIQKELLEEKYITEDEKIYINLCNSEKELLIQCWEKIHEFDPAILSGFNSDAFDYPYIYFRLCRLFNDDTDQVAKILSKFGKVDVRKMGRNTFVHIPEYPITDIRYLYMPRDEGGLNYGKKQASYSLDWISSDELKQKKVEYNTEGLSLDSFYIKDPVNYLKYNIVDVALLTGIDEKLKHIDLHNMLRRLMKTPFSMSLRGSAALFDSYVYYKLKDEGKLVRFATGEELNISISEDEIKKIKKPASLVKKWTIKKIDDKLFKVVTNKYPGAYVKDPKPGITTPKDGIIIDMDATSLYPSMIKQFNISFDSFFGRIIDPITYKTIELLKNVINKRKELPQQIYTISLANFAKNYTERMSPQNKKEYKQIVYLIASYLLTKISNFDTNIDDLFHPKTFKNYIMLKRYFIQFIDLIEEIHDEAREYNTFCYDYIINNDISNQPQGLYIIENIMEPTIRITRILTEDLEQYLKDNELIITLTGCLFDKHEKNPGLFIPFLNRMYQLRKEYKKKRDEYPEDSEEYKFYDMRQKSTKIVMNTTYGLYGLTRGNYRWGNKWLAKTITTQSRLTLKISQIAGEMFLRQYNNKNM